MAWTLVAQTAKAVATTNAIDTTGVNLIVVVVAGFSTQPITVSDNKSNTWNTLTQKGDGDPYGRMFWSTPTTVGSGHTFSTNTDFYSISVEAWSGANASPFDQQSGTENASAVTVQPGSLTPAADNELVVCGYAGAANQNGNGVGNWSVDSGFTKTTSLDSVAGVSCGAGLSYLIQTTATAANPTWTKTGGVTAVQALMAMFKIAASGGGVTVPASIRQIYVMP